MFHITLDWKLTMDWLWLSSFISLCVCTMDSVYFFD